MGPAHAASSSGEEGKPTVARRVAELFDVQLGFPTQIQLRVCPAVPVAVNPLDVNEDIATMAGAALTSITLQTGVEPYAVGKLTVNGDVPLPAKRLAATWFIALVEVTP
ncbi:MAG: hypothetical protein WCC05_02130, partial [Candidatus Sulfotelmatobacter sp.]